MGQRTNTLARKGESAMAMTLDKRTEMLESVAEVWDELQSLIDSLSDDQLETPDTIGFWNGRDMVAHLAGWDEIGIRLIREVAERGKYTPLGVNRDNVDAFNEEMLVPYRRLSTPEVRTALVDTHTRLIQIAADSDADVADIVYGMSRDHYRKHIPDLQRVRDA